MTQKLGQIPKTSPNNFRYCALV